MRKITVAYKLYPAFKPPLAFLVLMFKRKMKNLFRSTCASIARVETVLFLLLLDPSDISPCG